MKALSGFGKGFCTVKKNGENFLPAGASVMALSQYYFHVCIFVCVERYLEGGTPYFFLKIVIKWLRDEKPS